MNNPTLENKRCTMALINYTGSASSVVWGQSSVPTPPAVFTQLDTPSSAGSVLHASAVWGTRAATDYYIRPGVSAVRDDFFARLLIEDRTRPVSCKSRPLPMIN